MVDTAEVVMVLLEEVSLVEIEVDGVEVAGMPTVVLLLSTRRTTLVATLLGETLGYFVGPVMA